MQQHELSTKDKNKISLSFTGYISMSRIPESPKSKNNKSKDPFREFIVCQKILKTYSF